MNAVAQVVVQLLQMQVAKVVAQVVAQKVTQLLWMPWLYGKGQQNTETIDVSYLIHATLL
jgi:hypothetical protein